MKRLKTLSSSPKPINQLDINLFQRFGVAEWRECGGQCPGEQFADITAAGATDLRPLRGRHQCGSVSSQGGGLLGEACGAVHQVPGQGRGKLIA